jgi:hypothetical protein
VVLAVAANTSFGGLPVLMSLLSDDNRLPHLLGLRAERPVHRYGVIALAVLAGVLLIAVDAATARLIPLYAIGVFIGFTISQTGLVRHWHGQRSPRWRLRAALNGAGAVLTATAAAVFVVSKFTSGAWVVVVMVPALMLLFSRIESYYQVVGRELGLGEQPDRPLPAKSLVIVPVGSISKLTEHALHAALSLGDDVVAVSVHPQAAQSAAFRAEWDRWNPGVRLDTLNSPHRSLVHPIVDYVRQAQQANWQIAVLIPEVQPRHWRYRIAAGQGHRQHRQRKSGRRDGLEGTGPVADRPDTTGRLAAASRAAGAIAVPGQAGLMTALRWRRAWAEEPARLLWQYGTPRCWRNASIRCWERRRLEGGIEGQVMLDLVVQAAQGDVGQ